MTRAIRSPKDFWAGLVYAAVGIGAWWIARGYAFGTGARMGPGFFPSILAAVLFVFGLVCIARSFLRDGEAVGALAWKPLGLITSGIVLFGFLLPRAGLIPAIVSFALVAAFASRAFRLRWFPVAGLLGFVALCSLVFVAGLGVPMPLLGSWFLD